MLRIRGGRSGVLGLVVSGFFMSSLALMPQSGLAAAADTEDAMEDMVEEEEKVSEGSQQEPELFKSFKDELIDHFAMEPMFALAPVDHADREAYIEVFMDTIGLPSNRLSGLFRSILWDWMAKQDLAEESCMSIATAFTAYYQQASGSSERTFNLLGAIQVLNDIQNLVDDIYTGKFTVMGSDEATAGMQREFLGKFGEKAREVKNLLALDTLQKAKEISENIVAMAADNPGITDPIKFFTHQWGMEQANLIVTEQDSALLTSLRLNLYQPDIHLQLHKQAIAALDSLTWSYKYISKVERGGSLAAEAINEISTNEDLPASINGLYLDQIRERRHSEGSSEGSEVHEGGLLLQARKSVMLLYTDVQVVLSGFSLYFAQLRMQSNTQNWHDPLQ